MSTWLHEESLYQPSYMEDYHDDPNAWMIVKPIEMHKRESYWPRCIKDHHINLIERTHNIDLKIIENGTNLIVEIMMLILLQINVIST